MYIIRTQYPYPLRMEKRKSTYSKPNKKLFHKLEVQQYGSIPFNSNNKWGIWLKNFLAQPYYRAETTYNK